MDPENHECALIDVSCIKKVKQMVADQIICEQKRDDLDKTEHAVASPIDSGQAVTGLAKFEKSIDWLFYCVHCFIPW